MSLATNSNDTNDPVDHLKDAESFHICITSDKSASQFSFNLRLALSFILDVSILMPKFVAFYGQIMIWKVQLTPKTVDTVLIFHLIFCKGFLDVHNRFLLFAQLLVVVHPYSQAACQYQQIFCS